MRQVILALLPFFAGCVAAPFKGYEEHVFLAVLIPSCLLVYLTFFL